MYYVLASQKIYLLGLKKEEASLRQGNQLKVTFWGS